MREETWLFGVAMDIEVLETMAKNSPIPDNGFELILSIRVCPQ